MRHRPLLVVLAITVGLAAPREAAAFCQAPGPFLGTGSQLPLGCPVHVYFSFFGAPPDPSMPGPPRITVLRDGAYINVTGAPISQPAELRVEETFVDCQLRVTSTSNTFQPFEHLAIAPVGVQVGERIGVGAGWLDGIEIVAAGPCAPAIEPKIQCTSSPPCFEPPPFDALPVERCAAGPGGGLLIGLALLGLLRRRR